MSGAVEGKLNRRASLRSNKVAEVTRVNKQKIWSNINNKQKSVYASDAHSIQINTNFPQIRDDDVSSSEEQEIKVKKTPAQKRAAKGARRGRKRDGWDKYIENSHAKMAEHREKILAE